MDADLTIVTTVDLAAAIATCDDVYCACELVRSEDVGADAEGRLWLWIAGPGVRGEG